ncbi:MAG TPA: D-glycerate dehydrogenase [Candidatus Acidoferrales bacterium]|nr:D-glycerate dehydrogenase [Candidatus Acidoferrales bacterium]
MTQPLMGNAIERLRAVGTVEVNPDSQSILPKPQLMEAVRECEILCCLLHDRIDAEVIDAGPSLMMISDGAINPTNINVTRARERGIAVATIPNIVAEATADMQWALLLAVARRVVEADRALRAGLFPGGQSLHFAGATIAGKTFGSIGYGAIARFSTKRAHGFGMRVIYSKPRRLASADEAAEGLEYRSLDELLGESDFIAVNAAYGPETHHLIGERELGLMKPTAYVINTARGAVIDEDALVRALREGRIAGAGLDVFEKEPSVHPDLLALDNVVLTPHLGSASVDTRIAIADCIADNVLAFINSQQIHRKF